MRRLELSESQRADIVTRYAAGESARQIAGDFGVGHKTIVGALRRMGIRPRTLAEARACQATLAPNADQIIARYAAGEATGDIARDYDLHQSTVCRFLRESGHIRSPAEAATLRAQQMRRRLECDGKRCGKCGLQRPLSAFHTKPGKTARTIASICRDCMRIKRREEQYGLTQDDYDALLLAQDGACAICANADDLHVDHCHTTGIVRGLLCSGCNTAIGLMREDTATLAAAAVYLQRHAAS